MKQGIPSSSAEGAAFFRAAESMRPEHERVCYDPFAKDFLGSKKTYLLSNSHLLKRIIRDTERNTPGTFGCVAGRTRYIDDYLKACIDAGIKQLVILGAGYDSRAYRFRELKGKAKIFELDHQTTQSVKIERVTNIFGSVPDNVIYVPIDFENDKLDKRLFKNGYDRNLKTLFIWEGVTMYITAEAVNETLAFIATNSGKGSSIIFNYISKSFLDRTYELEYANKLLRYLEGEEPFRYAIDDRGIEVFLSERGFNQVNNVTGEFFKRVYFKGINENRKVCCLCGFATATVRP
ncbi:SAM-dependent methyltransferase [Chloroflexota bacterium]